MDNLDKTLRELTFQDHWRAVAVREGVWKGFTLACLLFSIISVLFLLVYPDLIKPLSQSACYAIYV